MLDGETLGWLLVVPCFVVVLGAVYRAGSSSSRALRAFDAAIAGLILLLAWSVLAHFVANA